MRGKKKILSLVLCVMMLFSMFPQAVFAEGIWSGGGSKVIGGLCEHHPKHTAQCGYTPGTAGMPCTHQHTEACYTLVTSCVHKHTEECYHQDSIFSSSADIFTDGETEQTTCTHVCSVESGCITKVLDCKHTHDGACGYIPATEGTPCSFVCGICSTQDSGGTPPSDAQTEECICETLCTGDNINADCPVCGAEGADLAACEGLEAQPATLSNALPATALAAMPNGQVLYVGNVQITSTGYWTTDDNGNVAAYSGTGTPTDNYIHYDESNNTLTLHNATIKTSNNHTNVGGAAIGVANTSGEAALTIQLEGQKNTLSETSTGIYVYSSSGTASLTITGSSSLTASRTSSDGIRVEGTNSGATLTIQNAEVTATSEYGIGVSVQASGGIVSGTNEDEVVSTDGVGIVFNDKVGTVYGSVTLQEDLTIGEGESLNIPSGASLTIDSGATLTNEGTVTTSDGGTLTNNGTINNSGTLPNGLNLDANTGVISGTPTTPGDSKFTVTATNDYGSDIQELSITIIMSPNVPVERVSLNKSSTTLTVSGTEILTATVEPANATIKDVRWSSDNTSVVTVDETGKVTAVGAGTATITVTTADGGKTATCTVTVNPVQYTVTVQTDGNGSASASPVSAAAGTEIRLTAYPDSGYRFKQWEAVSGGVTITGDTFIMPALNVTVKAVFERRIITTYYTLTFDTNGGTKLPSIRRVSGSTVDLSAYVPTREGCTFTGWYADAGLTQKITEIRLTGNRTVYAGWKYDSGTVIEEDGTVILPGADPDSTEDDTRIEKGKGEPPVYHWESVSVTINEGNIVALPSGIVITPEGGSVVAVDGTVTEPDGTVIDPDGTTHNPDGSVQSPDGTYLAPGTPKIQSVRVNQKAKTITVTYTRCENASGYDIILGSRVERVNGERRPVDYGKRVKKVTKGNTVTVTLRNAKKGTYYMALHAWNRTSGEGTKVFSPWSDIKKIVIRNGGTTTNSR